MVTGHGQAETKNVQLADNREANHDERNAFDR